MQRIGFWSVGPVSAPDSSMLYAGLPFEQWLQFIFLPAVEVAAPTNDFTAVPRYRVGLAALRNYDYHSIVEEALPLMRLCQQLEALLAPKIRRA